MYVLLSKNICPHDQRDRKTSVNDMLLEVLIAM